MSEVLYYAPGAAMRLETYAYSTTQVGTIGVRLRKLTDRSDAIARTTAGIAFDSATAAHWIDTLTAPTTAGEYDAMFDIAEAPPWPSQRIIVTYTLPGGGAPSGSDLTTLANAKSWLGITDATQDARLQQLITAASRAVMEYAQREFAPSSSSGVTRQFALKRDGLVTFGKWDLQSATDVSIDTQTGGSPTSLTADQYQLLPIDAPHGVYRSLRFYTFAVGPVLRQWFGLYRQASVTGTWGFAAIPADVEQAALITVAKWFKRDETAWSNELPTPSYGDGMNLPWDARMLVQPYKRIV